MLENPEINDLERNSNKFASKISLPFKCAFCILNFATEIECHSHNKEHFKEKCSICSVMVIEIAGCLFELKLHTHENRLEPEHNDRNDNTVKIKIEPGTYTTKDFVDDQHRNSVSECNGLTFMRETLIENVIVTSSKYEEDGNDEETNDEIVGSATNKQDNSNNVMHHCNLCDRSYSRTYNLEQHMKSLHSINIVSKKYNCEICNRSFGNPGSLAVHIKTHSAKAEVSKEHKFLHRCEICLKHFSTRKTLRLHQVTHSTECPFPCGQCDKKFKLNEQLSAHINKIHLGIVKTYPCHQCERSFSSSKTLNYHIVGHSDEYTLKCSHCDKVFKHKSLLARHTQRIHTRTIQCHTKYKCKSCDKVFEKQKMLNEHIIKDHNEELPYKCEICGKILASAGILKAHIKTHSDSKEFVCNYCGKAFNVLYNLKEHINSHTGNRPYECKECDKKFMSNASLRAHLLVHTGEKPCKCKIEGCNAAYMYDIDLKRHLFGAHGIYTKRHECPICQKIYPENKLLKKHLKRHQDN